VKMFDADKTRMIGLLYGEKNYGNRLTRFHLMPKRHRQTADGQIAISISRVSVLTRDKIQSVVLLAANKVDGVCL